MSLRKEISLEAEICEHIAAHDWLYAAGDAGYDRARALFPADALAWVQATQPQAWETLIKNHGAQAEQHWSHVSAINLTSAARTASKTSC
jgi:type I restriction enzyme, R subunit